MEKFAIGITIGAALAGTFHQTIATSAQKIKKLTGAVQDLGAKKMAVAEVRKYEAALVALSAKSRTLSVTSNEMRAEILAAKTAFHTAQANARKLGINTGKLADEERKLSAAIKKTNAQLDARSTLALNRQKRSELHTSMAVSVAPVLAVAAPITQAVRFESAMADVRKVVDFETPQAFAEMSNDVLRLSTRIPMAAEGLSQIIASAGQAGIAKSRSELLEFAEDAAKMGVAFDIGASEAGSMMANWRSGMALDQAQALSLANAVNHLSNNMNANAGNLGEVIQRQGAVAKAAGLTEIQTASLGAALLSSGASPEIAATALKNLTGALTKGQAATKGQQDAFADLGLDAVAMAKMMQTDAVGAITTVFSRLKAMPVEEQSALISELFGEESKGAIAPLLVNMEKLHQAFDLTAEKTDYAGSMEAEYAQRSATTGNNLELMRNRVMRVAVSLGTILLPALNALLVPIGALFDFIGDLAVKFPTLTAVVVGAGVAMVALPASILAVKYACNLMSSSLAFSRLIILSVGRVASVTRVRMMALAVTQRAVAIGSRILAAAQIALGAAMTIGLGPIGLIIAGVVALGVGAYLLIKHWDKVKVFFSNMWQKIKVIFSQGVEFAKQAFLNFTPAGWVLQMLAPVKDIFASIDWSASGAALVHTLANGIKSAAMVPVDAVKGMLSDMREYLPFSDAKKGPLSTLTASGQAMATTFGSGVSKGAPGLGAIVKKMLSVAASALEGPGNLLDSGVGALGRGHQVSGASINITQSFTVNAQIDKNEFEKILTASNQKLTDTIRQVVRNDNLNNRRVSLGGVQVV